MADSAWEKLYDGKSYKIYLVDANWADRTLWGIRYDVAAPDGSHVAYTYTLRGARRKIRNHKATSDRKFWEMPIVEEVPDDR